jgi:hypothetical protein
MSSKNTGTSPLMVVAQVDDASGFAIAPAAAATPEVIAHATLFPAVITDSSGCLTWDGTTGTLTLAKLAGRGVYEVSLIAGDTVGPNSGSHDIEIHLNNVNAGIVAREQEAAAAARSAVGVAMAYVSLDGVGDTVRPFLRVSTNADSVTIRQLIFKAVKVAEVV